MYLVECCETFELLGNGSAKLKQPDVFGWYNNTDNELYDTHPLFSNTNGRGYMSYSSDKQSWMVRKADNSILT